MKKCVIVYKKKSLTILALVYNVVVLFSLWRIVYVWLYTWLLYSMRPTGFVYIFTSVSFGFYFLLQHIAKLCIVSGVAYVCYVHEWHIVWHFRIRIRISECRRRRRRHSRPPLTTTYNYTKASYREGMRSSHNKMEWNGIHLTTLSHTNIYIYTHIWVIKACNLDEK